MTEQREKVKQKKAYIPATPMEKERKELESKLHWGRISQFTLLLIVIGMLLFVSLQQWTFYDLQQQRKHGFPPSDDEASDIVRKYIRTLLTIDYQHIQDHFNRAVAELYYPTYVDEAKKKWQHFSKDGEGNFISFQELFTVNALKQSFILTSGSIRLEKINPNDPHDTDFLNANNPPYKVVFEGFSTISQLQEGTFTDIPAMANIRQRHVLYLRRMGEGRSQLRIIREVTQNLKTERLEK